MYAKRTFTCLWCELVCLTAAKVNASPFACLNLAEGGNDVSQHMVGCDVPHPHWLFAEWALHVPRRLDTPHDAIVAKRVLAWQGMWILEHVAADAACHLLPELSK